MENIISATGVNNLITVASLFKQWQTDVKPHVYEMFGECQDSNCESWMEFLDQPLARDQITVLQWAFAENYLQVAEYEDSWAEEFSRLLTLLGVELKSLTYVGVDQLGIATYQYVLERHGESLNGVYWLPAKTGEPSRDDIIECLFLEYSEFEECQNDFPYYCEKYDLDESEEESKRLYDLSEKNFKELPEFFSNGHTLELSDVMSGLEAITWKL